MNIYQEDRNADIENQIKEYVENFLSDWKMPKVEFVKCVDPFFDFVWDRSKPSECRELDRPYKKGGLIVQMELVNGVFTGRFSIQKITNITTYKMFPQGLQPNYGMISTEFLATLDLAEILA